MSRSMWPKEERKQAKLFEERCEEIGGEAFVNSRQLNCEIQDRELRIDKGTGDAVLESKTELIDRIDDIDRIRGVESGIMAKRIDANGAITAQIKLGATKPTEVQDLDNAPVFDEELVKKPEDLR